MFVGRAAELELLEDAFRDVVAGTAVTVIVEGESGVGKSALVRRFSNRLSTPADALVLAGRCYEAESVPYKAFDGIVDALGQILQALPRAEAAALVPRGAALLPHVFPSLRGVDVLAELRPGYWIDPQELRNRMFAAVRELMTRLAARRPVVLVIDDLQWTDDDSRSLLTELLRPPGAPRMLVVCTRRPGPAGQLTVGDVITLRLAPLPPGDGHALALRLVQDAAVPAGAASLLADTITREAEGNPLFIGELARYAVSHQGGALPERLDEVILSRVDRLDEASRRVLETIAVAAGPIEQQVAARASRLDIAEFVPITAVLRIANLVRTTGVRMADAIAPFHDRVREAVSGSIAAARRREIHRELARAYQAVGHEPAEAMAIHLHGAGDDDGAARHAAIAAGEAMTALAFERAIRLYRLAMQHPPADQGEARALRRQLGDALASAGRGAEAAKEYLEAGRDAAPGPALQMQRLAAQQLFVSGHTEEGLAAVREVLAAQGMSYPPTPRRALLSVLLRRARLRLRGFGFKRRDASEVASSDLERMDVCWHVGLGLSVVDNIRGHAFQVKGLLLALRTGEPYRLARSLAMEAAFVSTGGGPTAAHARKVQVIAENLAREIDHPHALAMAIGARGMGAFLTGRFADAVAACDQAEAIVRERCTRLPWELATTRLYSTRALHYLGDFPEVERRVSEGVAEFRDRGALYGEISLRVCLQPFLHLYRDDPTAAEREVIEAMARWPARGFQLQHYFELVSLAHVELYRGDASAALRLIAEGVPAVRKAMLWRIQIIRLAAFDVRARAHLMAADGSDAPEAHLRAAESDAAAIVAEKMAWATPLALAIRAGIARRRGDHAAAVALLTDAGRGLTDAGMAVHAAAAAWTHGALIGGDAGDQARRDAEAQLRDRGVTAPARVIALLVPATSRAST